MGIILTWLVCFCVYHISPYLFELLLIAFECNIFKKFKKNNKDFGLCSSGIVPSFRQEDV